MAVRIAYLLHLLRWAGVAFGGGGERYLGQSLGPALYARRPMYLWRSSWALRLL